MKNYEKKAFLTTFGLFFVTLLAVSSMALYMYYEDRVSVMEQRLLYEMKDYTFDFKNEQFSLDIVEQDENKKLFKIYACEEGLCAYFQIPTMGPYLLKVIYAQSKVDTLKQSLMADIWQLFLVSVIVSALIASGFSMYSIRPMKEALHLLEEFLKDLIHDLNTPASSILLNSKLLRKRGDFEEIERIELSANTIASLHKNLQVLGTEKVKKEEQVEVDLLVQELVGVLRKLYPRIVFALDLEPLSLHSDRNALTRILDNLLTNACKYNKRNGTVSVHIKEKTITIEDTGIGIKDTKRVFERYYKENARGLGIGMSIVKELCAALDIDLTLQSQVGKGTKILLTLN